MAATTTTRASASGPRHERLGRLRQHGAELTQATTSASPAPHPGADAAQAVDAFVTATCAAAAAWRPGDGAAMAMQRAKLRLLQSAPDVERFDEGGLARVAGHLRDRTIAHTAIRAARRST